MFAPTPNQAMQFSPGDLQNWLRAVTTQPRSHEGLMDWVNGPLKVFFPFTRVFLGHGEQVAGQIRITHWLAQGHEEASLRRIATPFDPQTRGSLKWWLSHRLPFYIDSGRPPAFATGFELDEIRAARLGRIAAHGVINAKANAGTYFSFAGIPDELSDWHLDALTLIAPVLFDALADLDGKIDSADAVYSQLRIWQDANQDAISQATELQTLGTLGIQSINVTGTASNITLGGGNTQSWTGGFTRTSGLTGVVGAADLAGSLMLVANNFYREFTDDPATTAAALTLPQMRGSGMVRDLRPAMSLGNAQATALQAAVAQFGASTTRDAQRANLDAVIQSWGGGYQCDADQRSSKPDSGLDAKWRPGHCPRPRDRVVQHSFCNFPNH